jgi:phosphoenolpyruvate carboxykinase (ATP)
MSIDHTRALVRAALAGALNDVPTRPDPIFGLAVPAICPNVPPDILDPRSMWSDTQAYDDRARQLAARFAENFKTFADSVSDEVRAAGPRAM